ncbi:MAG: hypothetical protein HGA67_00435 [Candidatus Yonathbacteria bacterium]|nr:hypothetical protein [Candidatus Yonathbacteria bacterium]
MKKILSWVSGNKLLLTFCIVVGIGICFLFTAISISDTAYETRVRAQLQAFRTVEREGVGLSFIPSDDRKTATVTAVYPKGKFILFVRDGFIGHGANAPEWYVFGEKNNSGGNMHEANAFKTLIIPFDGTRDYFVHIAIWDRDGKLIPVLSKKYDQRQDSFRYYAD